MELRDDPPAKVLERYRPKRKPATPTLRNTPWTVEEMDGAEDGERIACVVDSEGEVVFMAPTPDDHTPSDRALAHAQAGAALPLLIAAARTNLLYLTERRKSLNHNAKHSPTEKGRAYSARSTHLLDAMRDMLRTALAAAEEQPKPPSDK
jgi:hypothetical protein